MIQAVDFKHRDQECPMCGWALCRGGFCIHYDQGGDVEAVYDGVPRGTGAALSATLGDANSQSQPTKGSSR